MKTFNYKSHQRVLTSLALVSVALPLLGVQVAYAQDELHPDWSSVWDQGTSPDQSGTMTVPANVVIPVTLDNTISSATARVGDIVTVTPISRSDGDSEFPPGTRIGGVVSQVEPATKSEPGVLDIDFQSALLPDGTEVPLHGFIASLDSNAVRSDDGHLVARDGSHVNAWKAIGIGGASGFVLGRLLKTSGLVPTILGAAGGYLYARSSSHRGEEAVISGGTTLGVRLESSVTFPDIDGYASVRLSYLETHRSFTPEGYGWDEARAVSPTYHYDNYYVVSSCPSWVVAGPYDYFGFPLIPVFVSYRHYYPRDPRWSARNSFWNRPDFHRGPRNTSWGWGNGNVHRWNGSSSAWNGHPASGSTWNNRPTNNRPVSRNNWRPGNGYSWNSPPSSGANRTWPGNSSRPNPRYNGSNSNRTWVGRPQPSASTSTGSSSKPTLSPIAPTVNGGSNPAWNSGGSVPRFDNSNSSSRGAGGWGGARGNGGGSFRGSGGRGGFSAGGRSGRR